MALEQKAIPWMRCESVWHTQSFALRWWTIPPSFVFWIHGCSPPTSMFSPVPQPTATRRTLHAFFDACQPLCKIRVSSWESHLGSPVRRAPSAKNDMLSGSCKMLGEIFPELKMPFKPPTVVAWTRVTCSIVGWPGNALLGAGGSDCGICAVFRKWGSDLILIQ